MANSGDEWLVNWCKDYSGIWYIIEYSWKHTPMPYSITLTHREQKEPLWGLDTHFITAESNILKAKTKRDGSCSSQRQPTHTACTSAHWMRGRPGNIQTCLMVFTYIGLTVKARWPFSYISVPVSVISNSTQPRVNKQCRLFDIRRHQKHVRSGVQQTIQTS